MFLIIDILEIYPHYLLCEKIVSNIFANDDCCHQTSLKHSYLLINNCIQTTFILTGFKNFLSIFRCGLRVLFYIIIKYCCCVLIFPTNIPK